MHDLGLCILCYVIGFCVGNTAAAQQPSDNAQVNSSVVLKSRQRSRRVRQVTRSASYNPLLEKQWTLPIKYFFDNTQDASTQDSIRRSIAFWESMTCARFREVTDRRLISSKATFGRGDEDLVVFTWSRVFGKQCIRNIFSRKHIPGFAANDEEDINIYRMINGCLKLITKKEADTMTGSLFYFYLNEQLPPFADYFLEAIDEFQSTSGSTDSAEFGSEDLVTRGPVQISELPGLTYDQLQAMTARYCRGSQGRAGDGGDGGGDARSAYCVKGSLHPALQVYTNGGCEQMAPPIDTDCKVDQMATRMEECIKSRPLFDGGGEGRLSRSFCPLRIRGRDGCRLKVTYEGRVMDVRRCTQQQTTEGRRYNGTDAAAGFNDSFCEIDTRVRVSGSLLSTGSSASVVFRSRFAPSDLRPRAAKDEGGQPPSAPPTASDGGGGGNQYLRFTVCFRFACDDEEFLDQRKTTKSSASPTTVRHRPRSNQTRFPSRDRLDMRFLFTDDDTLSTPRSLQGEKMSRFNLTAEEKDPESGGGGERNYLIVGLVVMVVVVVVVVGVIGALVQRYQATHRHRQQ